MTIPGNTQISARADRITTQIPREITRGLVCPDAAPFAELPGDADASGYLEAAGIPRGAGPPGQDDPAGIQAAVAVPDEATRRLAARRTRP